jgi:hypothetical protein
MTLYNNYGFNDVYLENHIVEEMTVIKKNKFDEI